MPKKKKPLHCQESDKFQVRRNKCKHLRKMEGNISMYMDPAYDTCHAMHRPLRCSRSEAISVQKSPPLTTGFPQADYLLSFCLPEESRSKRAYSLLLLMAQSCFLQLLAVWTSALVTSRSTPHSQANVDMETDHHLYSWLAEAFPSEIMHSHA